LTRPRRVSIICQSGHRRAALWAKHFQWEVSVDSSSQGSQPQVTNDNPVLHVTDATFETEVLQSALPVFVDFWAPWCGPCRMVAPVVEELAREYAGRIKFTKVDTDQNPGIASALGIQSIPTLALFQGNTVVDYRIGVVPREEFRRMFDAALAKVPKAD
jgi:thioredoxin 1